MSKKAADVQSQRAQKLSLHPKLTAAASAISDLHSRGFFAEFPNRLHVVREGGFGVVDAFLFLLVRFYLGCVSLKEVHQEVSKAGARVALAALAGRCRLMSTSPLSSVLSLVAPKQVRENTHHMLLHDSGAIEVLRHPWATLRDSRGATWHPFSFDGTREALRHAAPVESEEHDPIRRRSGELGRIGYLGHKRGDIVVHRSALQHDAGIWLDTQVAPGNGEKTTELASALAAIQKTCEALQHPINRALIRMDGEFGNVPDLSACKAAGIPCVSRLTRPNLLDQADIRERMNDGVWHMVPDGNTGPKRSALDLGIITLPAGDKSKQSDGTSYPPIDARVIVTRTLWEPDTKRRKKGEKADHGRRIGLWKYELFVCIGLDPVDWPASEVIKVYFGRCTLENRFAQEDREFDLGQIFSYCQGGQELACVAGLFVWNYQVAAGVKLYPDDRELPAHVPRKVVIDSRPVGWETIETEPAPSATQPDTAAPEGVSEPLPPAIQAPPASPAADLDLPPPQRIPTPAPVCQTDAQRALALGLSKISWSPWEKRQPGWAFHPESGTLRCPDGRFLPLSTVRITKNANLLFRAQAEDCPTCPLRKDCLSSVIEGQVKMKSISVPLDCARDLVPLLAAVHAERAAARPRATEHTPDAKGTSKKKKSSKVKLPFAVAPVDETVQGGPYATSGPFYDLARARKGWRGNHSHTTLEITVTMPTLKAKHELLVATDEERRHARLTRKQKYERYSLPEGSVVEMRVQIGKPLATLRGRVRSVRFEVPPPKPD